MLSVRVDGTEELIKKLRTFGDKLARRELKKAVNAAGQIVLRVARIKAPRGDGSTVQVLQKKGQVAEAGRIREQLYKSLLKKMKSYPSSGTSVAIVGPRRGAPHAHLVHDGTKPHIIKLAAGTVIDTRRFKARGPATIRHPGTRPQPFLADAFKQSKSVMLSAIQHKLAEGIAKLARET